MVGAKAGLVTIENFVCYLDIFVPARGQFFQLFWKFAAEVRLVDNFWFIFVPLFKERFQFRLFAIVGKTC